MCAQSSCPIADPGWSFGSKLDGDPSGLLQLLYEKVISTAQSACASFAFDPTAVWQKKVFPLSGPDTHSHVPSVTAWVLDVNVELSDPPIQASAPILDSKKSFSSADVIVAR